MSVVQTFAGGSMCQEQNGEDADGPQVKIAGAKRLAEEGGKVSFLLSLVLVLAYSSATHKDLV